MRTNRDTLTQVSSGGEKRANFLPAAAAVRRIIIGGSRVLLLRELRVTALSSVAFLVG
jgi:hypothetical protein